MIIDRLEKLSMYVALNPLFADVIDFLKGHDLMTLEVGKYPIRGNNVFLNLQMAKGRSQEAAVLETHIEMIDIQIPLSAPETYGYTPTVDLPELEYNEEKDIIKPAIEALEAAGIQAYGPYTADEFFGGTMRFNFDGILAMYDDQGNVPFKTLATEYGVKMKTGFPFVITTPDHDPCFDIAGKGEANPASLRHAIYAAIDIFRNRADYDEPMANPLPKLYHEKREDGEKARFAQKKPFPPKASEAQDAPKETNNPPEE